jgi:protoporphyrinogen oxidase
MATMKPVVILGAGPAGLTAAWELVNAGREVIVWEADASYVGGIARTVPAEGFRFDPAGQLFFSKAPEVNEFWSLHLPKDLRPCPTSARVVLPDASLELPLTSRQAVLNLGLLDASKVFLNRMLGGGKAAGAEENFAQWLINRHGPRLYELIFKDYYHKVAGLPCEEISPEMSDYHLKTFVSTISGGLYPRLGPGQMWEAVGNHVLEKGGGVFLDRHVQTIHWDETGATHVTGTNSAGEFFQQEASHILSTIPLRKLMLMLDPPAPKEVANAARALKYRELLTVCLIVGRATVFPETMLHIVDPGLRVANIQNFKNWSPDLVRDPKVTALGFQYFCNEDENFWLASDHDLAQIAIREASELGLAREAEIKDAFVVRTSKALPVYDLAYQTNLYAIKQWVGLFANLQPIGRNGLHAANQQDYAMMTAMLAVKNIQGGGFDCWRVDADARYPVKKKA